MGRIDKLPEVSVYSNHAAAQVRFGDIAENQTEQDGSHRDTQTDEDITHESKNIIEPTSNRLELAA